MTKNSEQPGCGTPDSIDFATFDEVMRRQYDIQIAEGGEISGLVAGDQGYDSTGGTIQALVYAALIAADDKGMASSHAGTPDWGDYTAVQDALCKLLSVCRSVVPQTERVKLGGADIEQALSRELER